VKNDYGTEEEAKGPEWAGRAIAKKNVAKDVALLNK
jgi:hypothetical protein